LPKYSDLVYVVSNDGVNANEDFLYNPNPAGFMLMADISSPTAPMALPIAALFAVP
jgi:hypothetical protein